MKKSVIVGIVTRIDGSLELAVERQPQRIRPPTKEVPDANGHRRQHRPEPEPLGSVIEHLKSFDLQLYTDPDQEEPSMEVPNDTIRKFYSIGSRRVSRWLFAQWLTKFGVPAKTADIQAAVAHLENAAYEKGVSLPAANAEERVGRRRCGPMRPVGTELLPPSPTPAEPRS